MDQQPAQQPPQVLLQLTNEPPPEQRGDKPLVYAVHIAGDPQPDWEIKMYVGQLDGEAIAFINTDTPLADDDEALARTLIGITLREAFAQRQQRMLRVVCPVDDNILINALTSNGFEQAEPLDSQRKCWLATRDDQRHVPS